jgi:predicted nucleic acid-binding protein
VTALLDTSIVVRYLTRDVEALALISRSIIESDEHLVLTGACIAEVGCALTVNYGLPREVVVDQLVDLVHRENLRVLDLDQEVVAEALMLCRPSRRVSFADAMIWAAARSSGINTVYSFDARFPDRDIAVRRTPA